MRRCSHPLSVPAQGQGIVLCAVKDTCHSAPALLCWRSQSHSLLAQLSGLCALCIPSGHLMLTFHRAGEAGPHSKGSEDSWPPKDRAVGLTLINWLPFTFPGSALSDFQGHLHLTGLKMFSRPSHLCPLLPPHLAPSPIHYLACLGSVEGN